MANVTNKKKIVIVVLAYNEESNIEDVYQRLTPIINKHDGYDFQVLLIDNCSEDNTETVALKMIERDHRWRYLRFSRNFGLEASLSASLYYSNGDALIYLPGDLQDPPEKISTMIGKWEEGFDVVYGIINKRQDNSILRSFASKIGYKLIHWLTETKIPKNVSDFRLISRPVINALRKCEEKNRYMRGMVHWTGFRQIGFSYDRAPRMKGETSIEWAFIVDFALNAIVSFSSKPLRWAGVAGIVITMLSGLAAFLYMILAILHWMNIGFFHPPPAGLMTLVTLNLFFGGIQCLFLGILGEYMGKVYVEVKQRPQWIIDRTAGFPDKEDPLNRNN